MTWLSSLFNSRPMGRTAVAPEPETEGVQIDFQFSQLQCSRISGALWDKAQRMASYDIGRARALAKIAAEVDEKAMGGRINPPLGLAYLLK